MKYTIFLLLPLLFIAYSCHEDVQKPVKKNLFYENGKVRRETFEVNGKADGKMTDFFNTGQLKSERFFKNGVQTGKTTIYFQDGKIKEVQYYDEKGMRINGDSIWYQNGTLQFTAQFSGNEKNGIMTKYDSTGKVIFEALMQNDTLLKVLRAKTD